MVSFDDGTCSFIVTHGADRESAVMQFVYMYYVPKILSTAVLINFALRGSKGRKKKKRNATMYREAGARRREFLTPNTHIRIREASSQKLRHGL